MAGKAEVEPAKNLIVAAPPGAWLQNANRW